MSHRYAFLTLLLSGLLAACEDRRTYKQMSASMAPTILAGESVFVDESAYLLHPPQRQDIIVFRPPAQASVGNDLAGQRWTFRVIGTPGDVISVQNDLLFVNGQAATYQYGENTGTYADRKADRSHAPVYPLTVPKDRYFVCGDGESANDSRQWGPLPLEAITGKVIGK